MVSWLWLSLELSAHHKVANQYATLEELSFLCSLPSGFRAGVQGLASWSSSLAGAIDIE